MIVRDEKINCAGGIETVLERMLPLFESAMVIDTGSKDGTRKILEKMQYRYSHLEIYYIVFKGYFKARNFGLEHTQTKWVFSGDADEIMFPDSAKELAKIIDAHPDRLGFNVEFIDATPDLGIGKGIYKGPNINPRCFVVRDDIRYNTFEELYFFNGSKEEILDSDMFLKTNVELYHFKPSFEGLLSKRHFWYDKINKHISKNTTPSQLKECMTWKTPNQDLLAELGISLPEAKFPELRKEIV